MFNAPIRADFNLRLLEERHVPAVFALLDRERADLRRWLPFIDATVSEEDTLSFVRFSLTQFAANEGFAAGIWNRDRFCGVIGTRKIDWMNRKVEVGYWLAKEFRGKGVMTDACRVVVTHLFQGLALNRVEIHCATENEKSAAIPRRLRFTLEGTIRDGEFLNGAYHDLLAFSMLKREWHA